MTPHYKALNMALKLPREGDWVPFTLVKMGGSALYQLEILVYFHICP